MLRVPTAVRHPRPCNDATHALGTNEPLHAFCMRAATPPPPRPTWARALKDDRRMVPTTSSRGGCPGTEDGALLRDTPKLTTEGMARVGRGTRASASSPEEPLRT